ncbi:membrane bound O-acyl transferase family-domain-containing protein [Aspergillus germanicus]
MAAEYAVASVTVAFTLAESNVRKLGLVFLLALAVVEARLLSFLSGPELLRGVFAFSCFVKTLHFVSLFLILRVEITQLLPQKATPSERLLAALNCVTSTRGIGTPWEVKPWTHRDRSQPPKPRTRTQYITRTLLNLIWQYVTLDLLNFGAVRYFQREWPGALAAGAEFLGPSSSKEQLLARLPLSCLLLVNLRLLFSIIYKVIALVVIGLFGGDLESWPPLFGRVWDLRRFKVRDCWAIYWHSLLRWPLITVSTAIQTHLIPTPATGNPQLQQITHLFLIFTISGILHMLSAIYAGVPENMGAILLFFVGNAAAIVVEDVFRPRPRAGRDSEAVWIRFLGFLGLLTWTYVSVPLFAYTALRIPVETNEVMPTWWWTSTGMRGKLNRNSGA